MNVTKLELCNRVSRKIGRPAVELKPIFDSFIDEVMIILAEGDRIELRGFGSFDTKRRKRRRGRNPRTGEEVVISAYTAPIFKFSKDGQKDFESKTRRIKRNKRAEKKEKSVQPEKKNPPIKQEKPQQPPPEESEKKSQEIPAKDSTQENLPVNAARAAENFSPA